MIVHEKGDRYDGSHRVVYYAPDEDGQCVPSQEKSDFDEQISSYYELREVELLRLQARLLDNEISPVGFFIEYCNMTVQDTASRMRMSQGKVRKHMTPKGFEGLKVRTLQRYARVFDAAVGDFFQFTHVAEGLEANEERFLDRLVQKVNISSLAKREESR